MGTHAYFSSERECPEPGRQRRCCSLCEESSRPRYLASLSWRRPELHTQFVDVKKKCQILYYREGIFWATDRHRGSLEEAPGVSLHVQAQALLHHTVLRGRRELRREVCAGPKVVGLVEPVQLPAHCFETEARRGQPGEPLRLGQ